MDLNTIYTRNIFNITPNVVSVNEIHIKAELNPDFHIDLLTIFNDINVDESLIFMQLYGDRGYPIFKIYKELLNNTNMAWISKWCKASPMEGKMEVTDDTIFEKLIVKIRLPNFDGTFPSIFQDDMAYFTLEMHPVNALTYIRFYIKSDAHVTVNDFNTIIYYANAFLDRCSKLNIYTIPLEYLQEGNVHTRKMLKLFSDIESPDTIDFYSAINFINISIQQYWDVLANDIYQSENLQVNIPRSIDTMFTLINWLYNNVQENAKTFNILLASAQIIDNHIPMIYHFSNDYIQKNRDLMIKMIIRFLKKAKMSYFAYQNMIKNSDIMKYLLHLHEQMFATIDTTWKNFTEKTSIVLTNTFSKNELEELIQKITNLFGVTINIGLNNINVLGILNVNLMYIIESALQIILNTFITKLTNGEINNTVQYSINPDEYNVNLLNMDLDLDFDDINDLDVDLDNLTNFQIVESTPADVRNMIENISTNNINPNDQLKYEIDKSYFEVYQNNVIKDNPYVDISVLKEIKDSFLNFEREIMAVEIDAVNKHLTPKTQDALTRLQKFDELIGYNKGYASACQSDKKPIIITIDEYQKLSDALSKQNGRKLTPYGEYINFILNAAQQFNSTYYYYICCMIFDFHQRAILNPYCVYVDIKEKLESVYYIPFSTANDLFVSEKWVPSGDNYKGRYDETKIVNQDGHLFYPDPSNNDQYVEMIKIYPAISRYHCIHFNASKNYSQLPYKFIPDIVKKNNLPCCFSKTQVIPKSVSNYNNSLNANNELYRDYKWKSYLDYVNDANEYKVNYDGVNRTVRLPRDINILFNNKVNYTDKYMRDEWCRRIVFQGYFISLFDFMIQENNSVAITHSQNNNMVIYKRPIQQLLTYLQATLTDDFFNVMKNGLIRFMFNTKEEFMQYCINNYFMLNEELLWEWVSETFHINLFIITKVNKHVSNNSEIAEHYMFEFPQGYNIEKLFRHDYSMFVYKYVNAKSEVIYDLIDRVLIENRSHTVNVDYFNPFIPTNYQFVQLVIQTFKDTNNQIYFDPSRRSYTPTATEFYQNVNLPIIAQTRTHNLQYTDNVIFKLPNNNLVIMPVYPITILPDTIRVVTNFKYPMYTRGTIVNIINTINQHLRDNSVGPWYYPRAVITNNDGNEQMGFIFDKNIHMYFRPIHFKTEITPDRIGDPTLQLVKQYYKPNNSIIAIENKSMVDLERDKYNFNKNLIKSIIFSVEYMLSTKLTPEWREELKRYYTQNMNQEYDKIGNDLYKFVEQYINYFTTVDSNKQYDVNISHVNISNIISNNDSNLVTSYKGSPIQNCYSVETEPDCNKISMCKWDQNMCKVCFNTEELKQNVINYIVNELLSSFNSIRYKIMYGSSFSTEPKVIQNYSPETQYVVNSTNALSAIETLNNLIRGDEISSLAENMKIVYTLTHNFNTIQKQQIVTLLRSLTNELNPENLYRLKMPCTNNTYIVNMFNTANDFWFTTMLQMAQRSGIVTIPDFRKALADILVKNKYIRTGTGTYIYNGFFIAKYWTEMLSTSSGTQNIPYQTQFDKVIDVFLSNMYNPTYIDFEALMLAPWNDYNIAILKLHNFHNFSKSTFDIAEHGYWVYDLNSELAAHFKYFNMICDTLPPGTTEKHINNFTVYQRTKYIVYIEVELDDGSVVYKQVVKYDPNTNFQSFDFTQDEIECLKKGSTQSFDFLTYGNVLTPIWRAGGYYAHNNYDHPITSKCGQEYNTTIV